jgi:hypothetical protein
MNRLAKTAIVGLAVALIGTTSAMADGWWDVFHPRRAQVNDRLENQNRRINEQFREGELTWGQAARLHRQDRLIRREEGFMASLNNGHITPAEQRALNQQENAVSRRIGE